MKRRNKILLYVLSLLMISLISFNTSFISAETSKTIINFIDEDGEYLDVDDTVSILKLEDQGGVKVPISVYIKDGKETTDYDNGTPLNELEVKDGKLEIEGLTKDDEYLLTFDNDYAFQKEVDGEIKYYLFGSFKGQDESIVYSNNLKSVDELAVEQLEEISGSNEVMEITGEFISIGVSCNLGGTFSMSSPYPSSSVKNCNYTGTANSTPITCDWVDTGDSGFSAKITYRGITKTVETRAGDRTSLSCGYFGIEGHACSSGDSNTCNNGTVVTQTYDWNGGNWCSKSSDTRTRYNGSQSCVYSSSEKRRVWGSCSLGSWSSSVSEPTCTKGDTTETATVTYNTNKGTGSTNVKLFRNDEELSKNSDTISRTVYWKFDGWSNFNSSFTSDTTAKANYSISSYGNWSGATLPTPERDGYTFTGWTADGNTYSAGQTVYPNGNKTYTANWEANSYEYTIVFKSSTGKILDTRKETHKFDETVTISHDPIPGYEVNDRQVKWNKYWNEGENVLEIEYQIITYNIEYSLELGNRYPSGNPTVNPNADVTTYDVEDETITFTSPTRTGYTFIGWYSEENFINEKPTIQGGSTGNVKVYAKFEANSYPLTVTNTNDRVSVTGTINGESYTLAPKQSITKQIVFDTDFTVTSDTTNPVYYTSDIRNHTVKDSYRSENITSKSLTTSMGGTESNNLSYSMEVGATRNVKTFTVELKNDNGKHSVSNTVTVKIYDNLTGELMSEISDEFAQSNEGIHNTLSKTGVVETNNSKTIAYTIPENTHLVVTTTNNSIQTVGYDNSSTGKTADYLTLVETPDMYSSDTKDIERKTYSDEIGTDYIIFTTFDNALDAYKGDTYLLMIVDNQYTKATYNFESENSATFKLYECLTESCTVKYNVQNTEHDTNYNYYANIISSEVEGESIELATISGTSGTFTNVDRYKTYKIVQESLTRDRYYSWDSGYSITTYEYDGAGTGNGTLELNKKSKMIKIDNAGVQYEPMFRGQSLFLIKNHVVYFAHLNWQENKTQVLQCNCQIVDNQGVFGNLSVWCSKSLIKISALKSRTSKILDERKETHKFDETIPFYSPIRRFYV